MPARKSLKVCGAPFQRRLECWWGLAGLFSPWAAMHAVTEVCCCSSLQHFLFRSVTTPPFFNHPEKDHVCWLSQYLMMLRCEGQAQVPSPQGPDPPTFHCIEPRACRLVHRALTGEPSCSPSSLQTGSSPPACFGEQCWRD